MRNTMVVMPARIVRQLAAHIAAYIAGLIDGEGTITLTRLHARENRRLVVSIANTEIELLNYVRAQVAPARSPASESLPRAIRRLSATPSPAGRPWRS
jgi:hypothetical protein